jgi:hypothetical protein
MDLFQLRTRFFSTIPEMNSAQRLARAANTLLQTSVATDGPTNPGKRAVRYLV